MKRYLSTSAVIALTLAGLSAQTRPANPPEGKTHRLEATPETVAYGYYTPPISSPASRATSSSRSSWIKRSACT